MKKKKFYSFIYSCDFKFFKEYNKLLFKNIINYYFCLNKNKSKYYNKLKYFCL